MSRVSRKVLLGLLTCSLVVGSFAGCSSNDKEESDATVDSQEAEVEEEAETEAEAEAETETEETSDASELSGTLTFWGWDDEAILGVEDRFHEVYPNIDFEFVDVQNGADYIKKIQTSIASGLEVADIVWPDAGTAGQLIDLGIFEDLTADPYNADLSVLTEAGVKAFSGEDGALYAIPWDMNSSGLAYKKDAALEYIGTDDPDEISAMITDWDSCMELGKKVHEESNGEAYLFASLDDLFTILRGQHSESAADGNTVFINEIYGPMFEMGIEAVKNGVVDVIDNGTPAYNASYTDTTHIFYPCAIWAPRWNIQANDAEAVDRWEVVNAPEGGFIWGGAGMGIPSAADDKDLAWAFIEWYCMSQEGAIANKEVPNYFINYTPAYEDASYAELYNTAFGEDNNLAETFFETIAPTCNGMATSKYDTALTDISGLIATTIMLESGNVDVDTCMQTLKDELLIKYPDVVFDD